MRAVYLTLLIVAAAYADLTFVEEVRQNYKEVVNTELNKQVTRELTASYVYQAYASFFGRADVSLPGFQKFFSEASKEEREHAQKLIDYVNQRGGFAQFESIDLSTACDAMASSGITFSNSRTQPCICEFVWTKSDKECGTIHEREYGLQAMEDALALERYVNDMLLKLHRTADGEGDAHLTHILEHEFLEEQVSSIRDFAGHVTRLRSFRNNYALGEYMYDQKLQ